MQKSAKERFCVKIANTQVWNNQVPKGPSRTKNCTESKFATVRKKSYGNSKTLRTVLRVLVFLGKRGRKTVWIVKTTAVTKNTMESSAVLLLVRKGPLGWELPSGFSCLRWLAFFLWDAEIGDLSGGFICEFGGGNRGAEEDLRVPNSVFQTVFFRLLTSACDRGKPSQRSKECPKTPVFSGILVPSTLTDPGRPLNTPLWKTPFRKHCLLL